MSLRGLLALSSLLLLLLVTVGLSGGVVAAVPDPAQPRAPLAGAGGTAITPSDDDDCEDDDDDDDDDGPCPTPTPKPTPTPSPSPVPQPELTLTKTAGVATYDAVGDVITYTFSVENTGNVTIAGPVTIDDDLTSDESCPALTTIGDFDSDLDVGETVDCSATYTIVQDDLDAGSVTNAATAAADGTTSNEDTATVNAVQDPELTLTKTADVTTYDAVGDVISYTFSVENTGNVTLAGPVTIDDDLTSDESCPALTTVGDFDSDLDVGETVDCTATYTIVQADIDAGSVTNAATAAADGTTSNEDTETVDAVQNAEMTIVKRATVTEYSQTVGFVVPFTFTVTNTGNLVLAGPVTVDDPITTDEACPDLVTVGDQDADFDPAEVIVCTASYAVTADDIIAGRILNGATAEADGTTSDEDTVEVRMAPTIAVLLDATGSIQGDPARQTVKRYNALLAKWQAKTQLAPYSLTLFNSFSFRELFVDRPIATIPRLTVETLNARGRTPLYDAAARAIRAVRDRNPVGEVIFVISTDGADNASTTETKASLVRLIRRMERLGWRFVYEGVKVAELERAVERSRP